MVLNWIMNVLVTASARFAITSDGSLWTPNASLGYRFWARYLDVYDEIRLCVRTEPYPVPPTGWNIASGPGIRPVPLPDFKGVSGFVKHYLSLKRAISEALAQAEAVQLRIPDFISDQVWYALAPLRPHGVEVIGDSYDVFAPGSVRHPLRPFFRWWFTCILRRQCMGASAAAYVTEYALQRRYPAAAGVFSTHYSSIELPDGAFVPLPRPLYQGVHTFTLIIVGTLAQLYKAPDVLIEAVADCVQDGLDLKLILVGKGRYRPELEAQVAALGLGERVCFRGQLPTSEAVRAQLDQADLFVLPSHQEGLPRAMIEAMARGLPCIGSTVGGIPELLPPEDMVPPGDVTALARKIRQVVTDPARMAHMSARNLDKAKEYREEVLRERRMAFYRYVRERTKVWLRTQGR
jgi:glycosyltransferase involved in cell wall biosynthesis